VPAVTRNRHGPGLAWYLATRLDPAATARVLAAACAEAGVEGVAGAGAGVEAVRRAGDGRSYLFVLNHGHEPAALPAGGVDLVTGAAVEGTLTVAAGGVAVVRERDGRRPGLEA
jgi:beta-galactosidase